MDNYHGYPIPQPNSRNYPVIVYEVTDQLAQFSNAQLENDAYEFAKEVLSLTEDESRAFSKRAPYLARDPTIWYKAAHDSSTDDGGHPSVHLTEEEKNLLRGERDKLFSQPGIFIVRLCVSLAGFLQ